MQTELDKASTSASKYKAYKAKVKIINPNNAGGNVVQTWSIDKTYISVDSLKYELGNVFAQYVSGLDFEIKYM